MFIDAQIPSHLKKSAFVFRSTLTNIDLLSNCVSLLPTPLPPPDRSIRIVVNYEEKRETYHSVGRPAHLLFILFIKRSEGVSEIKSMKKGLERTKALSLKSTGIDHI